MTEQAPITELIVNGVTIRARNGRLADLSDEELGRIVRMVTSRSLPEWGDVRLDLTGLSVPMGELDGRTMDLVAAELYASEVVRYLEGDDDHPAGPELAVEAARRTHDVLAGMVRSALNA